MIVMCKGVPIRLSADFSVKTLQDKWEWCDTFKVMKGKNLQVKKPKKPGGKCKTKHNDPQPAWQPKQF